jgi:hypothetical protein
MIMELELVYNEETQEWEEKPEPFITIECETEEDFEFIGTAVAFYKKHLEGREKPQTNADRIRAASDEELAQKLLQFNTLEESVPFCRNLAECDELLDTEDGIPEEKCKQCLLNWLRQPAEVSDG